MGICLYDLFIIFKFLMIHSARDLFNILLPIVWMSFGKWKSSGFSKPLDFHFPIFDFQEQYSTEAMVRQPPKYQCLIKSNNGCNSNNWKLPSQCIFHSFSRVAGFYDRWISEGNSWSSSIHKSQYQIPPDAARFTEKSHWAFFLSKNQLLETRKWAKWQESNIPIKIYTAPTHTHTCRHTDTHTLTHTDTDT